MTQAHSCGNGIMEIRLEWMILCFKDEEPVSNVVSAKFSCYITCLEGDIFTAALRSFEMVSHNRLTVG